MNFEANNICENLIKQKVLREKSLKNDKNIIFIPKRVLIFTTLPFIDFTGGVRWFGMFILSYHPTPKWR